MAEEDMKKLFAVCAICNFGAEIGQFGIVDNFNNFLFGGHINLYALSVQMTASAFQLYDGTTSRAHLITFVLLIFTFNLQLHEIESIFRTSCIHACELVQSLRGSKVKWHDFKAMT